MSNESVFPDQNISSVLPVLIGYPAIEKVLADKFVGEIISKEDASGKSSSYAEILGVALAKSDDPQYDLIVAVSLKTLTFLYRNRELTIFVYVSLQFVSDLQTISIGTFKIDSKGKSWLADQLLESVVNNFLYEKIKSRMNFDLLPHMQAQIDSLNEKLADKFEAKEGIYIQGSLDKLEILNLQARDEALWIFFRILGFGVIEITSLEL